jgi:hypothetical protein
VPWSGGADRITVPKVFKMRDKQTFIVGIDNDQHSVTLNVIPAAISDEPVLAAWMEEKECLPQAAAMYKVVNRQ